MQQQYDKPLLYLVGHLIFLWLVWVSVSWKLDVAQAASYPLFSVNSCTMLAKQPNQINVVTYNIGDDTDSCEDCPPELRMKALHDLLVANASDIVGLQEVWARAPGKAELITDMKALLPLISPEYNYVYRGHTDDAYTTVGSPNQGASYANMILSKLPLVANSYREHRVDKVVGDKEGQRYYFSVIVQTPQGRVRLFNIHTRAAESAYGLIEAATFISTVTQAEPKVPYLILGDFNQRLPELVKQLQAKGIAYTASCTSTNICFNAGIDLILVSPDLLVENKCVKSVTSNGIHISGPHSPVFGTFSLKYPEIIPVRGDFNGDGVVNVSDVQQLILQFNSTNSKYNLTGSENIDIFDLNEALSLLLQQSG